MTPMRRMVVLGDGHPAVLSPATVTITSTRAGVIVRPWLMGRHARVFEALMGRLKVARLGGPSSGSKAFRATDDRADAVVQALTSDGFTVRNNTTTKKALRK